MELGNLNWMGSLVGVGGMVSALRIFHNRRAKVQAKNFKDLYDGSIEEEISA